MAFKYSYFQRQQLKQLVLECEIQRFNSQESLAYIKGKMKVEISERYLYNIKGYIHKNVESRLKHLREHRTAFIEQLFRRIDEIEKYQKELWSIYHRNPTNYPLQTNCIHELHQLTITLQNLYEILPQYSGSVTVGIKNEKEPSDNKQEYYRQQAIF